MTSIESIALAYLETGAVEKGYHISKVMPAKKVSIVKWLGSLMITDPAGHSQFVIFEGLMPLHGGEISYFVNSITPIS